MVLLKVLVSDEVWEEWLSVAEETIDLIGFAYVRFNIRQKYSTQRFFLRLLKSAFMPSLQLSEIDAFGSAILYANTVSLSTA